MEAETYVVPPGAPQVSCEACLNKALSCLTSTIVKELATAVLGSLAPTEVLSAGSLAYDLLASRCTSPLLPSSSSSSLNALPLFPGLAYPVLTPEAQAVQCADDVVSQAIKYSALGDMQCAVESVLQCQDPFFALSDAPFRRSTLALYTPQTTQALDSAPVAWGAPSSRRVYHGRALGSRGSSNRAPVYQGSTGRPPSSSSLWGGWEGLGVGSRLSHAALNRRLLQLSPPPAAPSYGILNSAQGKVFQRYAGTKCCTPAPWPGLVPCGKMRGRNQV